MRYFLIAAVITYFSFLLFPETGLSQTEAECPAKILYIQFGEIIEREIIWRDGTLEPYPSRSAASVSRTESAVSSLVRRGNIPITGKWVYNGEKWEYEGGGRKKIRSGWVYIEELKTGKESRWILCSELQ